MPNPQQQQAGNAENSLDFLWIIVMIVAAIVLIWYFGKDYISDFVFKTKSYEITAINFVIAGWMKLVQLLHLPLPVPQTSDLAQWSSFIQQNKGQVEDYNILIDLATAVGKYLCYPVAAILAVLGVIVYRSNLTAKFKSIFSMKKLEKFEYKDWPQITPVVDLDLVKQNINEGPWAMSMTPMDFCKKNNLLKIEKENEQTNVSLISGAAHRVLSLQLGAIWNGAEKMPIYAQALFAIFAARANRDREGSDKLLHQISASSESGKLNFTGTQELLIKHVNTKLVKQVVSKHAYILTAMASMLELARTDGVLASAEFLWLKPVDRKLWYMLNSVGRQTAVAEVAGPFAHWIAEKTAGRPLNVPMVDEGVKSLEVALKEIIYEPEDE